MRQNVTGRPSVSIRPAQATAQTTPPFGHVHFMLFHSIDFALFFPIVFGLYWTAGRLSVRAQNTVCLIAGYIFYAWWDWRFLSLLLFSSAVDYTIGLALGATQDPRRRKHLLWTSLGVNLGLLGIFKYLNFFIDNLNGAFQILGQPLTLTAPHLILPVGISFYTFQTLSHTIDVYHRRLEPTRDPLTFFLYVGFFPQLVAGPIERAANLIPQLNRPRTFTYDDGVDGMRLILWGLFKKMVIADNCAHYADLIFAEPGQHSGSTLALGCVLFAFQIYGDFSGYSDIAIGTARLLGIRLMRNFATPYFSRNLAEFWRRWHISLSTWFRDYLYLPMGGSRVSKPQLIRNVAVVFLISGFWHGPNWTFLLWGALHAAFILPIMLSSHRPKPTHILKGRLLPSPYDAARMLSTFAMVCLAWIPFRANSLTQAGAYLTGLIQPSLFSIPNLLPRNLLLALILFITLEWLQRERAHTLDLNHLALPKWVRWGLYYGIICIITAFAGRPQTFIYFQF